MTGRSVSIKKIIKSFADDLIYPAFLGSIFYDLFSNWFPSWTKVFITLIFLFDWLLYKFGLHKNKGKSIYSYLIQILIPIVLTLTYYSTDPCKIPFHCSNLKSWPSIGLLMFMILSAMYVWRYFKKNITYVRYRIVGIVWFLLFVAIATMGISGVDFSCISLIFIMSYGFLTSLLFTKEY